MLEYIGVTGIIFRVSKGLEHVFELTEVVLFDLVTLVKYNPFQLG